METNIFLHLSIILITGIVFGKIAKKLKLPSVTGYLVGGLLIGPYFFNFVPETTVNSLNLLSDLALGFIAFSIGTEFKFSYFKRVGLTPIVIGILEAIFAIFFVTITLLLFNFELPLAITLGAIAAATAPAATVMVIKQYNAKGPVTQTLLSVVAIDDAVALICFGFAAAFAKTLTMPNTSFLMSVIDPLYEVGISLVLGVILGFILAKALKFFNARNDRYILAVTAVFVGIAASTLFHASQLLLVMALSATFANLSNDAEHVLDYVEVATPPILMMFFVISGSHLDLRILPSIGVIGLIYVVMRVIGKLFGAWLGATLMKSSSNIRKYLGPALIPQAGVAIGLTVVAQEAVPQYANTIRAVILCAVLIYELVGPIIAKQTLQKAGEIEAHL